MVVVKGRCGVGVAGSIGYLSRGFVVVGVERSGKSETRSALRVFVEREEGTAHSEAQGGGGGTGLWNWRREVNTGKGTEDLTWGYRTPQGQLFMSRIRQGPERGVQ